MRCCHAVRCSAGVVQCELAVCARACVRVGGVLDVSSQGVWCVRVCACVGVVCLMGLEDECLRATWPGYPIAAIVLLTHTPTVSLSSPYNHIPRAGMGKVEGWEGRGWGVVQSPVPSLLASE